MPVVTANPGNCNFEARVEATADEGGGVQVSIACECSRVQEFAAALKAVSATCAAGWKCADFFVYGPARKSNLHPACPVPVAVIKAIEVAGGLALPQDVVLRFED